ncbi:EF-hand domain-containing protein [archaeon]|nr:MAG: EF-hand domain-containing protein [archaeon]
MGSSFWNQFYSSFLLGFYIIAESTEEALVESSIPVIPPLPSDILVEKHADTVVVQPNTSIVPISSTVSSVDGENGQRANMQAPTPPVISEVAEAAVKVAADDLLQTPHSKRELPAELSPASSFQGSVLSLEGMDNITSPNLHKTSKSPYGRHTLKASKNSIHNMSSNSMQSGFSGSTYNNLANPSTPGVISAYATSYNKLVQRLREKLFLLATDEDTEFENYSRKFILTNLFQLIDDNDSGVVTKDELESFLTSAQLDLFSDPADPTNQKFLSLLIEQIDAHRDGNIRVVELEDFLWPKTASNKAGASSSSTAAAAEPRYESGIVIDLTRKALLHVLGAAAAQGPEEILAEFAKLSKVSACECFSSSCLLLTSCFLCRRVDGSVASKLILAQLVNPCNTSSFLNSSVFLTTTR